MIEERAPVNIADEVSQAKAELVQLFGAQGGATARAADFGRVLPWCGAEIVREALESLAQEGSVEVALLADGAPVYHFIRH